MNLFALHPVTHSLTQSLTRYICLYVRLSLVWFVCLIFYLTVWSSICLGYFLIVCLIFYLSVWFSICLSDLLFKAGVFFNCLSDILFVCQLPRSNGQFVTIKKFVLIIITKKITAACTATECPKIYRKSVLHLLKYRFAVNLSRCSIDLR